MIIFSHILATYLLGKILKLETKKDWFLAFGFGVGIDFLDVFHIVNMIRGLFLGEIGRGKSGSHYYRSFIQEPVSLFWIVPLSLIVKTPLPLIFFILHFVLDYCCKYEKRPFWPLTKFSTNFGIFPSSTYEEFIITGVLLLILILIKRHYLRRFFFTKNFNENTKYCRIDKNRSLKNSNKIQT